MSTELIYLTWVTALTAVLWMPYILNMIAVRGLLDAVGYPENPPPMVPWVRTLAFVGGFACQVALVLQIL